MTVTFDADDVVYFNEIHGRRKTAYSLERREYEYRDGNRPRENDCHANAIRCAAEAPGMVPVHGWLIETEDQWQVILVAHSVVSDEAGRLIDVTPMAFPASRFLVHHGKAADFFRRLPRCNQVLWPVLNMTGAISGSLDDTADNPSVPHRAPHAS